MHMVFIITDRSPLCWQVSWVQLGSALIVMVLINDYSRIHTNYYDTGVSGMHELQQQLV